MTDAATEALGHQAETEPSPLNPLVDALALFVRGGLSPEDAAKKLATWTGDDQVKAALAEYRKRTGRIRSLREPGAIIDDQLVSWYMGPQDGDKFWPALERHLRAKGRAETGINSLDAASTKIVSLLQPPGAGLIRTRGLVVGYVQSGKTENFTAVISKAADVGYRLFIVLSGMNNALRNQTQDRLTKDIIQLNPEEWISLTDPTHDFRATTNVNAFLTDKQSLKILGVLKKNKMRLARLLRWLTSARPEVLQNCPVILVDDEADQASPNSAKELADRTEINRLLVAILATLPKAAYVGYTATPFANLLIDPVPTEDLYPRDFIVDLPRPDTYFGPERIFGREPLDWEDPDDAADGLDMVRIVPEQEVAELRPPGRDVREGFYPAVTDSLRISLRYFLLTAAARRARGQAHEHCSMLLHTTEYTSVHDRFKEPLEAELTQIRARLGAGDVRLREELRELWEKEQAAVPPTSVGCIPLPFDEVAACLGGVLERVQVKLEHGKSTDRLVYPDVDSAVDGKIYIVVGGNVLSRGLTIEGLTVSFFVRSASAYDTLLQMGRWFGYRPGYADLPRLWMTQELKSYFYHLAVVEQEIRYDIDKYKNGRVTPLDFGVRIRQHPFLAITSKLKMQNVVTAKMSFAGQAPQTLVFQHKNKTWLDHNINAAKRLIAAIRAREIAPTQVSKDRANLIFKDVPSDDVLAFLSDYEIHESHDEMQAKLIRQYVEGENTRNRLLRWNVGIVTRHDPRWGTIDLGLDHPVPLINRARHKRNLQFADMKALMSGLDIAADVEAPSNELKDLKRPALLNLRDELVPDRGLLLLYPINKDSVPLNKANIEDEKRGERLPLQADSHVIGLAMVFPSVDDATEMDYVTVDLSAVERDDVEDVEDVDD